MTAVVVTGTREPLAPERLAADVVVIDTETIRATTADSLADLLRRQAGVQISRNGGPGQSTGLFIRGAASAQSVVLVDGVRVGSATLGFAALESLSLSTVERIEVLRGPGSSIYGADAVGGVVQIFTARGAGEPRFQGHAAVGGYGSGELSAGVSGAAGMFDLAATLASERSDGVSALRPGDAFGNYNPDDDGTRLDSGQLNLGLKPAAGHRIGLTLSGSRLDAQYDASEFLPPSYAQDASPDFRRELDTTVAAIDWRGTLAADWVGSARASRSVDDETSGGQAKDRFRTERQQITAQLAWQTGVAGQLVAAVEYDDDQAESTAYTGDVSRSNTAGVLELTGGTGPWSWQADVRLDDNSDYGSVTTGRLGVRWAWAPSWTLRALAGNSFRAPSFNDLYYPGYGVSSLQPERGRSVEAGLSWREGGGEASVTVYRNRVSDLIAYEPDRSRCPADPAYDFGCAANVNSATLQGATLGAAYRTGAVVLKAQYDYLDASDGASGAPLARRAENQGTLGADWTTGAWTWAASVLYLGTRPDGGKQLAAETTLDLAATWRIAGPWSLQAKLLNATDEDREPVRDYQGLGRQAWLVLRYAPN
ncbi:MAG: TonB-dependent receptor [Rubrivivax sp.]|nr:TonB-dependent receptor [Rubrivivax sp.]